MKRTWSTTYWLSLILVLLISSLVSGVGITPLNVNLIDHYDTPGNARDVFVVGDYAYIADEDSISVVDVSKPTDPVEVGFSNTEGTDMVVGGGYAYVTLTGDLRILDISDPTNPALIGVPDSPHESITSVFVDGNHAYIPGRCNYPATS